eukprot:6185411-Pleurochrysis_carterae.AAC.11
MDFLNTAGVRNDTIMVVELRIREVHRAAKSSMDWTSRGAQFHSQTLGAFLNGLYDNADKDNVIPPADSVHKRIRYQLVFSEMFLMPNTCVPPIHITAPGTPDWWVAFKRTIMEIGADVGDDMNAAPSKVDTAIALIKRMKHAFEVHQLRLHDPGSASAMRTAQLNLFNVVVKNAFLRLRFWCSETEQMRKFDKLRATCPISTFRLPVSTPASHFLALLKRVRSRRSSSNSLFFAIKRYLEPAEPCCRLGLSQRLDV